MTRSLKGKVAVVTGGGSGMGRAICTRLAEDGAAIAIWDLNGDGAAETARMITDAGGTALAVTADCANKDAIRAAAEETRAKLGPVSILVNNAGIVSFYPYMEIPEDVWDRMIAVNLKGPHLVCREIIPDMLAAGWGRIINITSSSTQSGSSNQAHYVASKGGLLALTKALAVEFGGTGITVNMIPPGAIVTPMMLDNMPDMDPEAFGRTLPVKRIGQPDDIAAAAAFLASEEASYMTGQTISVNGGRYMGSA